MNNYEVTHGHQLFFLKTNMDSETTRKTLIKYFSTFQLNYSTEGLINYFISQDYYAEIIEPSFEGFLEILTTKNYSVIDL